MLLCLQAKYDHAVAAAQKSMSKHKDTSDSEEEDSDEEEQEGSDEDSQTGKKARKKQRREESALEKATEAAEHIQSVLAAQRRVQQLQEAIQKKKDDPGQRRCVCAFVTFKTEEARLKCMQANPSSRGKMGSHLPPCNLQEDHIS